VALSPDERVTLEAAAKAAGPMSLAAYIRWAALRWTDDRHP
jgi:hypothetical protein